MGKKSSKAPDTKGAAAIEGKYARETARDTTYADRPDQYNPFGAMQWGTEQVVDPATGELVTKWTQSQTMNPEIQAIIDANLGMMRGRAGMAGGMMGRIQSEMGSPADWAQFGDVQGLDFDPDAIRGAAEDAAYRKEAMRLEPQFAKRREQLMIQLRNQGLRPGDQAYDAAMSTLGQESTDAFERARLGATEIGRAEAGQMFQHQMAATELANALREQQIAEYLGKRSFSLGEADRLNQGQGLVDLVSTFSGEGG